MRQRQRQTERARDRDRDVKAETDSGDAEEETERVWERQTNAGRQADTRERPQDVAACFSAKT